MRRILGAVILHNAQDLMDYKIPKLLGVCGAIIVFGWISTLNKAASLLKPSAELLSQRRCEALKGNTACKLRESRKDAGKSNLSYSTHPSWMLDIRRFY